MIGLTRIVPFAFSLAAGFAAAGCRSHAPLPLPDAARASGLRLSSAPSSLVIRPGSSGRVTFLLHDELGLSVPDYPLTFAIRDDGSGDGTANARLSSEQGQTDDNGAAELEIIVGNLASDNRPSAFSVAATCPGSNEFQADILVTTNVYSVEILPMPPADVPIVATRLLFFDATTCGDLDLTNLNAAPIRPRTPHTVSANASFVFSGVAASGSHAVVGLGLDSYTSVQVGGCIDIPGASLFESETIRATLFMDRLFPVPQGTFQIASDFTLVPPPSALARVQSVWRQWAGCPLDPAQLWLDCTLDALATNPASDPLDCVPVPGAEGSLGALLFPRRGAVVAPPGGGTPASTSDTPCRSQTDSTGNGTPSLESIVNGLFSGTSGQLLGAKLGALPSEIATLLDGVRIDSQMTITAGSDLNGYTIKHDLLGLTFPDALTPISFATPTLGLPVSSVFGILATLKSSQLSIPSHSFTLRLGTSARYAFEATSLKSRGARDSLSLVKAIFGLAQWSDQGAVLSGCSALDAAICDQVKQARGCLVDACQSGLDALGAKLAGAFDNLDGKALDFLLYGVGPVVDLDGDGRVDALGLGGRAGSASVSPGLWSATFDTQGGTYGSYGSWTATRVPNSP